MAMVAYVAVKMLLSVDREADDLAVLGQAFKVTVDGAETDVRKKLSGAFVNIVGTGVILSRRHIGCNSLPLS